MVLFYAQPSKEQIKEERTDTARVLTWGRLIRNQEPQQFRVFSDTPIYPAFCQLLWQMRFVGAMLDNLCLKILLQRFL